MKLCENKGDKKENPQLMTGNKQSYFNSPEPSSIHHSLMFILHFQFESVFQHYLILFVLVPDMLLTQPIDRDETCMPSPTQLKRKFIIKVSVLFATFNPESLILVIADTHYRVYPFLSDRTLSLSSVFTILSQNFQRVWRLTD